VFSFCFLVRFDMIFFFSLVFPQFLFFTPLLPLPRHVLLHETRPQDQRQPTQHNVTATQPDRVQRTQDEVYRCGPFSWLPASHRVFRTHSSLTYLITETDVRMCLITVNW